MLLDKKDEEVKNDKNEKIIKTKNEDLFLPLRYSPKN